MRRVFTALYAHEAQYIRDILVQDGIEAVLRNVDLGQTAGEIPFHEVMPEVWVMDEATEERARRLILEVDLGKEAEETPEERWDCACGEAHEGQFDSCWSCGTVRPRV